MIFFKNLFKKPKELADANITTISSLAPKILTKKEELEKIQPYLDKLKETIDSKGVNNIALTGGYGSGKSTILKTFKARYDQYKYLNVSLASFNQKTGELGKIEKENLERLLEVSILQQIFYHVAPDKIPESRFKRIINRKWWHFLFIALAFMLWVMSSIILIKYDYLDKLNPNTWRRDLPFSWFGFFSILISFGGIGLLSKLVLQIFSNSKINKVNIKGELELGEKSSKSVFNEHLEEILYFFERTVYNVVIIEDLDRFDNTDIFTKLREINILLNNSNLIKREINFIYAVGDNLIKDKKERVKFFEYIIPIIPFINSTNAREQLQKLINESGLEANIFSREFMSDVVTFIDDIDMRLLINIFHEFVIYRNTIKPEFVKKPEELFAIITYKNIEPEDFSLLNNKQGKLYSFINNKKEYINKHIDQINQNIKEKEIKIQEIKEHSIADEHELRKIYIFHILKNLQPFCMLEQQIENLLDDDGFQNVINNKLTINQFTHNSYGQYYKTSDLTINYQFPEIENEVNSTLSYEKRLSLIRAKRDNQLSIFLSETSHLKEQLRNIESQDLYEIFQRIDLNDYLKDFSNNNLLRSLIINGYINENYNHYISLFHEGTVSRNDLIFDQNVRAGFNTEFSYKLDKIEGLLETLDIRYFNRESILNFDLVNYLGYNYNIYKLNYDHIVNLLITKKERAVKFIDEYISDEDRSIDIFIKQLTKNWEHFLYFINEESNYDINKKYRYLRLILTHVELKDIMNQNHSTLIELICNNPSFLSMVDIQSKKELEVKICSVLKKLDIKFEKLDASTETTEKIFDYIYDNNLYKINIQNLEQMLERYSNNNDKETFRTQNYKAISTSGCHNLIEYINENINEYVKAVYLELEKNIEEEEKFLITLLNQEFITTQNRIVVSDKIKNIISDISKIHDESLILYLLKKNKLVATWENLQTIYHGNEDTLEIISEFINTLDNAETLSGQILPKIKDESGKMIFVKMWKDILSNSTLSDLSLERIIKSGNIQIVYFDFENTDKGRLEQIITYKGFALENKIFDSLEEYDLGQLYLENYKEKILRLGDDFIIEEQHLSLIIKSEVFNIEEINTILDKIDISDWTDEMFLSNLHDRLYLSENLKIKSDKIIEVLENYNADNYNLKILINYFKIFNEKELSSIFRHLSNKEYHKYLSKASSEGIIIEHTSIHDTLIDLMKRQKYVGEKSRRTKKGYIIYKNKDTVLL